jgi:hypothetical protein
MKPLQLAASSSQLANKGRARFLAVGQPLTGGTASDGALDVEQGIDALYLCLLKTPKDRERLEIFGPPPYRRGHDHDSFHRRFHTRLPAFVAAPAWNSSSSRCDIR